MNHTVDDYLNYVCYNCFETLDRCHCNIYPPEHLIMIDRNIQEHIRRLNRKGYRTISCCESHYKRQSRLYISFAFEYNFNTAPSEFRYDKSKRGFFYDVKGKSETEFENKKMEKLNDFLEWIISLPENK